MTAEMPNEVYLVEPLIPSGGLVMLHGKRGLGKSQFCMTLSHAIVNGLPLFGRMKTASGPVLMVQVDMTQQIAKDRLERIFGDFVTEGIHFWLEPYMDILTFSKKHALVQAIEEIQPSLVIWDTLRKIHHMKENQSETAQAVYSTIRRYVPGPTHLFVHHDKKTQIDKEGELDPEEAFRGTGDWLDSIDTSLQLQEVKGGHGSLRLKIHKCRTMGEDGRPHLDLKMDPETLLLVPNGTSVEIEEARNLIKTYRASVNGQITHDSVVLELVRHGFCGKIQAGKLARG